ncbi:MAG: hypothetical protein HKM07_07100 [Chlamydiae bacterium]|jgi:hypothetical protein|nr:hypothetical protein [Chlamydiota bacterium]
MIVVEFFEKMFQRRPAPSKIEYPQEETFVESHFKIKQMYEELNVEYFQNKVNASIVWFGDKHKRSTRRKILGSYDISQNKIKINRILDHSDVPYFFVSFIIFHEMLHSVYPPKRGKRGRWQIHHREFKQNEKNFSEYARAKAWEKANKHRFLVI